MTVIFKLIFLLGVVFIISFPLGSSDDYMGVGVILVFISGIGSFFKFLIDSDGL